MKNANRIFGGLCFIAAAAVIIMSQMGLITMVFSLAQVIIGILAVLFLWFAISERSLGCLVIPLGLVWIGFGKMIGLPDVPLWVVIVSMLFLAIGLEILFPKKRRLEHQFKNWDKNSDDGFHDNKYQTVEENENGGCVFCSNRFGALAKYITNTDLKRANLNNSFGEMKVYFDKAQIEAKTLEINVNNSFGLMELFVPFDWVIKSDVSVVAGACKEIGKDSNVVGGPEVHLVGGVSFGEIQIHYV